MGNEQSSSVSREERAYAMNNPPPPQARISAKGVSFTGTELIPQLPASDDVSADATGASKNCILVVITRLGNPANQRIGMVLWQNGVVHEMHYTSDLGWDDVFPALSSSKSGISLPIFIQQGNVWWGLTEEEFDNMAITWRGNQSESGRLQQAKLCMKNAFFRRPAE
ncbi:hypothetical protein GUITHDRAFT_107997 [Guillardia theta CCMP2712]|uniref:Uncharacterized protein n=1 Tax=Guillardia theta (strain CCMP2712) TaxID=905079 RepID=L1JCY0_GUITC|nr:hypothetical protein GUITHDRAFT_107997 [Guillardia theta CCMP2712]EKX45960.1 hypothetical protein GUITHDRAFT_107997 [Guillardia theta CCMP2712]|eukprot:XP_005832940.1 hypothetical protein GUITHDRAFT_107997 [Guillardia theta CCMP2712]